MITISKEDIVYIKECTIFNHHLDAREHLAKLLEDDQLIDVYARYKAQHKKEGSLSSLDWQQMVAYDEQLWYILNSKATNAAAVKKAF